MVSARRHTREHEAPTTTNDHPGARTAVAPIDHDWSARGDGHVLRCPRFVANGVMIDRPLTIYAHFAPQTIVMERWVRAEGFLVEVDRRRLLWIGTESGVARMEGGRFTSFTTADGLPPGTRRTPI